MRISFQFGDGGFELEVSCIALQICVGGGVLFHQRIIFNNLFGSVLFFLGGAFFAIFGWKRGMGSEILVVGMYGF